MPRRRILSIKEGICVTQPLALALSISIGRPQNPTPPFPQSSSLLKLTWQILDSLCLSWAILACLESFSAVVNQKTLIKYKYTSKM